MAATARIAGVDDVDDGRAKEKVYIELMEWKTLNALTQLM